MTRPDLCYKSARPGRVHSKKPRLNCLSFLEDSRRAFVSGRQMKTHTAAYALLLATPLCLSPPFGALGQKQKPKQWTWEDIDGNVRSRADLDEILREHKQWVKSSHKSGACADLLGANLSGAWLQGANLAGANLWDAKLYRANVSHANLRGTILINADLRDAFLAFSDLERADLFGAHLDRATLNFANLRGADLMTAHLNSTEISLSDLNDSKLADADLTNAFLFRSNLVGASLMRTTLKDANLTDAEIMGVVFEPKDLPTLEHIALAYGLDLMEYGNNPGPLTQLRKQFQDAGYRGQERAITCALNREEARRDPVIQRWFKRMAFDFTCQYGLSPGRSLRIVVWLWLSFACV